jgi:integrase
VPPLVARFEAKVDRSGDHHLWTGALDTGGAGQIRVDGRLTTARRVAWELARGDLPPGARVIGCPDEPACVRIEHLTLAADAAPPRPNGRARAESDVGSKVEVRPGVWKLTVTVGRHEDGTVRRAYRTVLAATSTAAARSLAAFVADVDDGSQLVRKELRDVIVDEAVEQFLSQHLRDEKGRAEKTISDYRKLHRKWFAPVIGRRPVRRVDEATIDRIFGRMQRAGLSRSRLNQAKSLYSPFFRWAKRRRMIAANPMAEFQLPTSRHVSRGRTPPEVDELCLLLETAVEVAPDIAPILVLGAVTGMRRGELVGIRRSRMLWDEHRITVDTAIDPSAGRVKGTKTRHERSFHVDAETVAMLSRHCEEMDARATLFGVEAAEDPFVFSRALDCSKPMAPDHVTKRVALVKEHLGIADKRPETLALEDEALRLYSQAPMPRPSGRTGPAPKGGMSFAEIGQHLGRSERWAVSAVRSAQRRQEAGTRGKQATFDGSILALRRFTSSELLDAGFNISMVAQRQGHGPQVLMKHYAKSRESADRKAAEHLGRIVHRSPSYTTAAGWRPTQPPPRH